MPRKVEFIGNGGKPLIVSPADIVACVQRHTSLDPRYFLGTAQHETDFTSNEVDTEESGYISKGIWQLGVEEATSIGMHDADLLDLEEATIVFAKVTERRVSAIDNAAISRLPNLGFNAYLMIAHNQGLAACLKTIALHGLNWAGYKMRNLQAAQNAYDAAFEASKAAVDAGPLDANGAVPSTIVAVHQAALEAAYAKLNWWKNVASYGDDCISGGERWSDLLLGPQPNV